MSRSTLCDCCRKDMDNARLVYENAKLRDLVLKMRYGATWTREAREYIETQMRELGIEASNE